LSIRIGEGNSGCTDIVKGDGGCGHSTEDDVRGIRTMVHCWVSLLILGGYTAYFVWGSGLDSDC